MCLGCHRAWDRSHQGSRVSLDSILHHFKLGATAEQIVQSFPSASPDDVYLSIAYYLTHRQEIEAYIGQRIQRPILFKNNWNLILTIKSRSPSYAHASWAGGPLHKGDATPMA